MILKFPIHDAFHRYMIKLNTLYQEEKELHYDYDQENFQWLDCHQEERCIYAIGRKSENRMLAGIFNFSDKEQSEYELEIPGVWQQELLLHTDWQEYGGEVKKGRELCELISGKEKSKLIVTLSRYSGILLSLEKDSLTLKS